MKGRTSSLAALAAVGIWAAGCSSSGGVSGYKPKPVEKIQPVTVAPGQEADLFPVKLDATWTYDATSNLSAPSGNQSKTAQVTFKVTSVKDTADGKEAKLSLISDERETDRLVWRITDKGIYQVVASYLPKAGAPLVEVPYEPPLLVCTFPVDSKESVKSAHTGLRPGGGTGAFTSTVRMLGSQEVDTGVGKMSAIASEEQMTYTDSKGIKFQATSTNYWAPKVGLVRYVQEVILTNPQGQQIVTNTTLKLKSHS